MHYRDYHRVRSQLTKGTWISLGAAEEGTRDGSRDISRRAQFGIVN